MMLPAILEGTFFKQSLSIKIIAIFKINLWVGLISPFQRFLISIFKSDKGVKVVKKMNENIYKLL